MDENHQIDRSDQAGRNGGSSANIRFSPFELDVRAGELRKEGHRIRLQEQPFQILRMLLDSPGEVVLREEIRHKLWPNGTVVEFDHSINAAVKRLRDALRDSAEKPRYIETLARRGYRFIGTVETQVHEVPEIGTKEPLDALPLVETNIGLPGPDGTSPSEKAPSNAPREPTRILTLALVGATVILVLSAAWLYQRRAPTRWAREVALPEATRFVGAGNYPAAFPFIYRGLQILPADSELKRLQRDTSHNFRISTIPSGASVEVKPYDAPESQWLSIGQSPIERFLLPFGYFRWRITKPGFRILEVAAGVQSQSIEFRLEQENNIPPEMVHVPAGRALLFGLQPCYG